MVVSLAALISILLPLTPPASDPVPTLLPHPQNWPTQKMINDQCHFQINKQQKFTTVLISILPPLIPPASDPHATLFPLPKHGSMKKIYTTSMTKIILKQMSTKVVCQNCCGHGCIEPNFPTFLHCPSHQQTAFNPALTPSKHANAK